MDKKNELRIIVIDDNPAIYQDFKKILIPDSSENKIEALKKTLFNKEEKALIDELPRFQIESASQGIDGIRKIRKALQENKPFALAFVDIRMPPGLDGIDTIKEIWKLDLDIQMVICTAFSDYSWEETVKELGLTDNLFILRKPFESVVVRQIAGALTTKWQNLQDIKTRTQQLEKTVQERTVSLKKSLSLIRTALESSYNGIIVIDNNDHIVDFNKAFLEMWDIPESLMKSDNFPAVRESMLSKMLVKNTFLALINQFKHANDETNIALLKLNDGRFFECYSHPHQLDHVTVGRVWSYRDITKRINLEAKLEYQTTHDPLTSLPNRALLIERIQKGIAYAVRNNRIFSMMLINLDHFKQINDHFSIEAGNELLFELAKRLRAIIRAEDTIARLGADEFVLISTSIYKQEHSIIIGSKMLSEISKVTKIVERYITLTASIGITIFPQDGSYPEELLRKADLAMRRAKSMGGNQFQFYTSALNDECTIRLEKETEMRRALINNEFFLHYHPQYDVQNEKITAVEALLRWAHPNKGVLFPKDFIPLAEETGLIVPLGEWILKAASEQNKTWQKQGFPFFRVAVHLTTKQFMQTDLVASILRVLDETGLKAECLAIEVTEEVMTSNINVKETLIELRKLGVYVSLDDFGTGDVGLNYLRNLPIDQIKLDKKLINKINNDHTDEVIIQSIIGMAKSLDINIVADGVENQAQLQFLETQHCQIFQGGYFSKPLTAEELERLLNKEPF